MTLDAAELATALQKIALWRTDPEAPVSCPRCGREGLEIQDRSARPYAEWYHLACAACGLLETIHIPLGPPVMGGLD
ncbi:MAG: hypothetical protein WC807_08580 [Hyphomicrobium sp.]|jgi:hypothetical protein